MKKLLFFILLTGISFGLSAQKHSSDAATSEVCFKKYMELKSKGMYDASDKWMIRFAKIEPNDLRTKDYNLYRSELKNLLLDNGNYTIVSLKHNKSLRVNHHIVCTSILKKYNIKHPYVTSDGKNLYFDSSMPGGYGKSDLYCMTKKDDGSWGKPENLGDKVNTEGDELYPCFKKEGHILFFSSNGRFGLGGLDIFIYAIDFSGFGKVYNAGYPLNSRFDEYALDVNDQVQLGYFKSNRPHGRGFGNKYSVTFH